jgi:hypothetical protein
MSDIVVYDSGEIELKIALKNETLWLGFFIVSMFKMFIALFNLLHIKGPANF